MKTLPEILQEAKAELDNIKEKEQELRRLASRKEELTQITEAIQGLKSTKEKTKKGGYVPGKCDTAYYYVESMAGKEIRKTEDFKPGMTTRCPDCGSEAPIMMSYTQTEDSPDGDWWSKQAFYICCGKLTVLKSVGDENRF